MSSETATAADRPRLVDVAFGLMITAAVAAVAFAVVIVTQVHPTAERQASDAASHGTSVASLEQTLLVVALIALGIGLVYAAVLVWTGLRLRAGRRNARVRLVVLAVLAVLPLNPAAWLVALLLAAAAVLAFRKPVGEWLRRTDPAVGRLR